MAKENDIIAIIVVVYVALGIFLFICFRRCVRIAAPPGTDSETGRSDSKHSSISVTPPRVPPSPGQPRSFRVPREVAQRGIISPRGGGLGVIRGARRGSNFRVPRSTGQQGGSTNPPDNSRDGRIRVPRDAAHGGGFRVPR